MKHSSIESAKKSLLSLSSVLSDASLSLSSVLSDASLSLSSACSKKKKKKKKNVFRVCKMVFFPL